MKFSLILRSPGTLKRSEARACLAANLALPGAGSLAAGRPVGYAQLAVAFAGLIISLVTGIPMLEWAFANFARLTDPASPDPLGVLWELWLHMRWPLAGIFIFAIATVWAAATGLRLVSKAPKEGVPPRIEPER
ncbi:MAG TPA: hypothetical protein VH595_12810 [Verrucomicrobiae bacterium]|jgi:hypothetical protein|nr:hypothetical protein [Verrucomicrobiae bacterium]